MKDLWALRPPRHSEVTIRLSTSEGESRIETTEADKE